MLGCSACLSEKHGTHEGEGEAEPGEVLSGEDFHSEDIGSSNTDDDVDTEVCDGIDNDGDGEIDEGLLLTFYIDEDGDGWGDVAIEACEAPEGSVSFDGDCDDTDPTVNPDAEETCNETDDDCDGSIDEGLAQTYYVDLDGDGYGNPGAEPKTACSLPEGYVENPNDCDDTSGIISPDSEEMCNGADDNCDGRIDEGVSTMLYPDTDGDGYGVMEEGITACWDMSGYADRPGDCDDEDLNIHPEAAEICDEQDNDCDGLVDVHAVSGTVNYWVDLDGDGHGAGEPLAACAVPEGFSDLNDDCDDTDASRAPSLIEACNGFDDDCDGSIDEGVMSAFYIDADSDGYGAGSAVYACSMVPGTSTTHTDCDDSRADVRPDADEVCDGLDNDCNSIVDDSPVDGVTYYEDLDLDGYGDPASTVTSCVRPIGYSASYTDCDPERADTYPGAVEICDDLDNDCDGSIDEDPAEAPAWYMDTDGDGFGDPVTAIEACDAPTGRIPEGGDCDDSDDTIHPGAEEVCNHADDDCDGGVDVDATDMHILFEDEDDDGYGTSVWIQSCELEDGYAFETGDCDDDDDDIHPYAPEDCDAFDQDCDGVIDNGADDCPCTQRNYGANSYWFCNSTKKWTNARNYCTDRDYNLVSVGSWSEQNWLLEIIRSDSDVSDDSHWIGLNDRDSERWSSRTGWHWQNGEGYSYHAWASSPWYQPDNAGGEDCVEVNRWYHSADNDWNDLHCNDNIRFICEAGL
jgi:large repetitive protein